MSSCRSDTMHGKETMSATASTLQTRSGLASSALRLLGPLLAGGLFALSCPPYDYWPLAWLVPALVLLPLRNAGVVTAYAGGVVYAVVIGSIITSWGTHAASAYFGHDVWTSHLFILGVHVIMPGVPCGIMAVLYARYGDRFGTIARPLAGAFLWSACEWARAWLVGWELLAHSQYQNLTLIQISNITGAYGVSFVMVALSLALGQHCIGRFANRRSLEREEWLSLAIPSLLLFLTLVYGGVVRSAASDESAGDPISVAIVQGNVANEYRWKRAHFGRAVATYAQLTSEIIGENEPDLIFWPENAVSFYLNRETMLRSQLRTVASRARHGLVLGAPRRGGGADAFNSVYLIEPDGQIGGVYDKRRLLPFGEFDPFARFRAETPSGPIYTNGTSPEILTAGGIRLGPTICFEILSPQLSRDLVRAGAEILVNLSNDSWMDPGDGNAPRQHISMAVFRAVESRRFLIRSSSSGVSGIISPYGEISDAIGPGRSGGTLAQVRARAGLTPYVVLGDLWIAAGMFWFVLVVSPARRWLNQGFREPDPVESAPF